MKPQSGQVSGIGRFARIRRRRKTVSITRTPMEVTTRIMAAESWTGPVQETSVVEGFSVVVVLGFVSVIIIVVELLATSILVDVCVLKLDVVLEVELPVV